MNEANPTYNPAFHCKHGVTRELTCGWCEKEAKVADSNPTKTQLHARVDELAALAEGWDSYGSPRIHTNALSAAHLFIEAGLDIEDITPTSEGFLALSWRNVNDPEALTVELREDSIDDGVEVWAEPLSLFVLALNGAIAAVKSEASRE